jgi:mycothiol synthase
VTSEVRAFRPEDAAGVRAVMEASLAVDAIPGFLASDIERAMVRIVPDPTGTAVALEDGAVVGYCTPHHDDLTVLPEARRRGHGRRLVAAGLDIVRGRGFEELQLYVPLHLPAAQAFAEAVGLRYRSSLWQFRLAAGHPVPGPAFPPDVVARPFSVERDAADVQAWTAFMHAAFEGHPTRMTWTPAVIAHVHTTPGFDPSLILVLEAAGAPDQPIGFCRLELVEADAPFGARLGDVGSSACCRRGAVAAWAASCCAGA